MESTKRKYIMKNKKDGRGRPKGKILTEEEKITKKKRLLQYQKEYYIKNKDSILKKIKNYQDDHRPQIRAYNMRYYYNRGGTLAAQNNKYKYKIYESWHKDKLSANLIRKQITMTF